MKITSQEEYGLRCLLNIARNSTDSPLSAQAIADTEGLSLPYTQKILRILSRGDLIEAKRGAYGGYRLARPVERISVGDAVRVLGGVFDVDEICERHTGDNVACSHSGACTIRPIWSHIAAFVARTLDSISLVVLLQDEEEVSGYLDRIAPVPPDLLCPVGVEINEAAH